MPSKTISLTVSEQQADQLALLAEKLQMTDSEVLRSLLRTLFARTFDASGALAMDDGDLLALRRQLLAAPADQVLRSRNLKEFARWWN